MTKEEEKEFEELALLEEFELEESKKKNYAPSVEEMAAAKAATEPSTGEALATGWIEGTPFLKDAVAAYDGMSEAMEEDDVNFDSVYGNYKEKLDETNQDINAVQEQAPWTAGAGEVVATVGQLAGAGAVLKGGALTAKGVQMGSAVGVGAAQQLSRSEDRGVSDVLVGGAIGGVSEVAGNYLMSGVKKGGKYLMDKADDIGANAAKKILGIGNVSSKKSFAKHLVRTSQKESEFLGDVLTQRMDGELVINFGETPERMLDKVKLQKGKLGSKIGNLYKKVDAEHDIKIDIEDLKSSLSDDVVSPFMASDDPGMNAIGQDLDNYIQSIGRKSKGIKKEVTPEGTKLIEEFGFDESWNLTRVHKLQKDIRKRIETIYKKNGLDLNASKEQQRRVATSLGKHMDEVLDTISSDADDVIKMVKKDRVQYGNMRTVEDSLEAELYRAKDDPAAILKEAFGMRSLMISGAASAGVGPAGMVAGPVMNRILNSPKTPLYMASGLKKIATVIQAAPTGEIASKLNTAALMSNDKFKDTLYGVIGEINLKQQPLPRSAKEIKMRHDDVRNFIKMKQPSSLADFDTVMETNDEGSIGAFMDQISKIPGADKLFEPGIGIDGVVHSPEDKQVLELQLKQSDIPGAQRIQMLNALRSNGIVPNMDEVVKPQPKVHIPRAKKIQDY